MTAQQRRDTIIQAALPLLAEFGAAVTTAQIARAAGIGEATIFRVFDDKDAVLQACITAALDPANVLRQLHAIDLGQPLTDRLVEAVEALDAHLGRVGTVIGALHASGTPHRRSHTTATEAGPPRPRSSGRDAARAATRAAVLELFTPDQDDLRIPAEIATDAFLALFYGRGHHTHHDQLMATRQLVDLFLHGALTT
jgi:AcrR family transcriptional regulator